MKCVAVGIVQNSRVLDPHGHRGHVRPDHGRRGARRRFEFTSPRGSAREGTPGGGSTNSTPPPLPRASGGAGQHVRRATAAELG